MDKFIIINAIRYIISDIIINMYLLWASSVINALHILSHLILPATLRYRCCYSHFITEVG